MIIQKLFCLIFHSGATLQNKLQREGEYYLLNRFVGEIFPPYKCTHGPGEVPFEAVMCAVGAASQISHLLIEDSIFNTKYHLNLCRISKYKVQDPPMCNIECTY